MGAARGAVQAEAEVGGGSDHLACPCRDLLGQEPQEKLEIRLCPDGSGQLYVPGLTEFQVQSVDDINKVQAWGAWGAGKRWGDPPTSHAELNRTCGFPTQPLPGPQALGTPPPSSPQGWGDSRALPTNPALLPSLLPARCLSLATLTARPSSRT